MLKRAGDIEGAARALEQARLMDKSDRFLNGKSGKYWLRAGQIEKAQQVFGLFTKVSPCPGAVVTVRADVTDGGSTSRRKTLLHLGPT